MRKTVTGVSLAAFLALGAVACGSSPGSDGDNGLLPSGGASPAPSATASSPAGAAVSTSVASGVQSFPFPADVKVVFQTPLPASGAKRGAMIGYENYVDAVWYAIDTHGKDTAYERYVSGNVLIGANALISEFKSHDWTLHGTVTYYDMSVPQVFGSSGAVVQACVDVSQFDVQDSDGKTGGSVFPAKYAHYLEQSSAGKTTAGYWTISHTTSASATSGGSAGMCI